MTKMYSYVSDLHETDFEDILDNVSEIHTKKSGSYSSTEAAGTKQISEESKTSETENTPNRGQLSMEQLRKILI